MINVLRKGNGAAKVEHGGHVFGTCGGCRCEVEVSPGEVTYKPETGNVVRCPHCARLIPVRRLDELPPSEAARYRARMLGEPLPRKVDRARSNALGDRVPPGGKNAS